MDFSVEQRQHHHRLTATSTSKKLSGSPARNSKGAASAVAALPPPPTAQTDMFFHATLARAFIQSLKLHGDDDFVDRLNYYYTPIMLAVGTLIISAKQYAGTHGVVTFNI